ncbi:MAG: phage/plasmid primase, P4 family [Candidatus Wallbacteria bacterium]
MHYIATAKANAVILELSEKCIFFKTLVKKIENNTLNQNECKLGATILWKAGHEEAAIEFLNLQTKITDNETTLFINECKSPPDETIICTTIGCDLNQIMRCFAKIIKNSVGVINNSPCQFIQHPLKKAITCIKKELMNFSNKADFKFSDEALKSLAILKIINKTVFNDTINNFKNFGIDIENIKISIKPFFQEVLDKEYEKKGINFSEKGGVTLNGVKYARHILNNFTLAITSGMRFFIYKNGIWSFINDLELSRLLMDFLHNDLKDSWTTYLEKTYIEPLKRLAEPVQEMDNQKNFINVVNGMLDIENFILRPHRPSYHSTIRIPLKYDPNAKAPNFLTFLNQIFENDNERISLVLEIIGLCLTSETKAQKAFIFWGKGGNGKSVLSLIIKALCGDANVSSVPMKDLENSFARSELVGKTLNLATENEFDSKGLNSQYFKSITTGDPLRVEEKFKPGYTISPFCKLLYCLNMLPYCSDHTYGFLRRLIIVPFTFTVDEKNDNKNLVSELMNELPGIMNLSLEALARLRKNNYVFTKSNLAEKVLNEYKEDINPMEEFIREYIQKANEDDVVYRNDIRKTFDNWCFTNGHHKIKTLTDKKFWASFRDVMINKKIIHTESRRGGKRCFKGIKLIKTINDENNNMLTTKFE